MPIRALGTIRNSLGDVMSALGRLGVLEVQITAPDLIFEKVGNVGEGGTKSQNWIGSKKNSRRS